MLKKGTPAVSVLALALSAGSAVAATDYEWVGGAPLDPTSWNNPANWQVVNGSGTAYPGADPNDTATIPAGSSVVVTGSPAYQLDKIIIQGANPVSISIDSGVTLSAEEVELQNDTQLTITGSGTFEATKVRATGTETELIGSVSNLIVGTLEVAATAEMAIGSSMSVQAVDVKGSGALLAIDNQALTIAGSNGLAIASNGMVRVDGSGVLALDAAGTNPIDGTLQLASSSAKLQINDDNVFEGTGTLHGLDENAQVAINDGVELRFDDVVALGAMTFDGGTNAKLKLRGDSYVHASGGDIILRPALELDDSRINDSDSTPTTLPTQMRWLADTGTIEFQNNANLYGMFTVRRSNGGRFLFNNTQVVTMGRLHDEDTPKDYVDCQEPVDVDAVIDFVDSGSFAWTFLNEFDFEEIAGPCP